MSQYSDVIAKSANFIWDVLIEVSYIRQGSNYSTLFGTDEVSEGEFWAPNVRKDVDKPETVYRIILAKMKGLLISFKESLKE